ncbi:MAG: hypothetical protein H6537_04385 [Bacteroidales bacterium]|nr:hypothetical protein [Bacteroidales bacterium]HRX30354.1 DUF6089 family protein [Tenuifilaceae bacterium]
MARLFYIFLIAMLSPYLAFSQVWKQHRVEVNIGLPITHFFGDIGGSSTTNNALGLKDISYRSIRGGFSGGISYRLTNKFYARTSLFVGYFGSSDKGSVNEARNYGFSTFGTEVSVLGQYYLIPESDQNYFYNVMQLRGGLSHINRPFSLYIFGGWGFLFYKDTPLYNLATTDLYRFDDSQNTALVIPFGIGIKYQILPQILLGAELGGRYAFSDVVDGFSPAASKYNDMYYILNFNVYYRIPYQRIFKKFKWNF